MLRQNSIKLRFVFYSELTCHRFALSALVQQVKFIFFTRRREITAEVEENGKEIQLEAVISAHSQSSVSCDIIAGNCDAVNVINPTTGAVKTRVALDFEAR